MLGPKVLALERRALCVFTAGGGKPGAPTTCRHGRDCNPQVLMPSIGLTTDAPDKSDDPVSAVGVSERTRR